MNFFNRKKRILVFSKKYMHITSIKDVFEATTVLISVTGHKIIVDIHGVFHLPSHTFILPLSPVRTSVVLGSLLIR